MSEPLANENTNYPSVMTNIRGEYVFTADSFSDAYPDTGRYFIYVKPPSDTDSYWPGGDQASVNIELSGPVRMEKHIKISDQNSAVATYIGSRACLICHDKQSVKHTLHFVGIRKIGTDGQTQANGLMDLEDTSVYNLNANNQKMLSKFSSPSNPNTYRFANDGSKTIILGKDQNGLYFQLSATDNPKFYIKYTYGGQTGKWRGLFLTTVSSKTGLYAPSHGVDGSDYVYFEIAPFQYNEDPQAIYGDSFVTYHAERWDFYSNQNSGFIGDIASDSYDLACAACHGATRIETIGQGSGDEYKVAVYAQDLDGYALDNQTVELNVGCEKCHGPGSRHVYNGGRGYYITVPDQLSPGRAAMICGTCHIQGKNNSDVDNGIPLKYDGAGNDDVFKPGMSPAQFFATIDQTGKHIAPFGTSQIDALSDEGYLKPVNLESDEDNSWQDMVWGATVNHSRASQQHYLDFVRTHKFSNSRQILTCTSCHDAHGSANEHMLTENADNNALCLSCHSGTDSIFQSVDKNMVDRLIGNNASQADIDIIGQDISAHIYDKTGTLQMSLYDPEGTGMGRCTLCHMPKSAKSAAWHNALVTGSGQYRHGDISSHTFDVMSTEAVNAMANINGVLGATPAGISDKCGSCHAFAGLH